MKVPRLKSIMAVAALALAFFSLTPQAYADSYQLIRLDDANGTNLYGMDANGTVVLSKVGTCGGGSGNTCYETYVDGVLSGGLTLTPPDLVYDNGVPCSLSLPSDFHSIVSTQKCNNGFEAFGAWYESALGPEYGGLFVGPDPILDLVMKANIGGPLALNSAGDIAFFDAGNEYAYVALRQPSAIPEPQSAALLGTGVIGLVGVLRRRYLHC